MNEKDQFVAAVERYLHSVSLAEEVGNSGREYIRQYLTMENRGEGGLYENEIRGVKSGGGQKYDGINSTFFLTAP